jgi:hypothetical protein
MLTDIALPVEGTAEPDVFQAWTHRNFFQLLALEEVSPSNDVNVHNPLHSIEGSCAVQRYKRSPNSFRIFILCFSSLQSRRPEITFAILPFVHPTATEYCWQQVTSRPTYVAETSFLGFA